MTDKCSCSCCAIDWKSPKFWLKVIGVLALVAILRDRIVNYPQWQINVSGEGRVSYVPDIANINLGVQVDKADKAEKALTQLNTKMAAVFDSIVKAGIAKEEIQTQNYYLNPQYDYIDGVSKLSGYSANQSLIVKVRSINENKDLVNKVVTAASKAGINQVNGITFEYSNFKDIKQEARLKAIADARGKAGAIAGSLDVKLRDIVGMWENVITPDNSYYYGGKGGADSMSVGASPVIPAGNLEYVVEVNVNYRIK